MRHRTLFHQRSPTVVNLYLITRSLGYEERLSVIDARSLFVRVERAGSAYPTYISKIKYDFYNILNIKEEDNY